MKGLPTIKKLGQFRFCPENDGNIRYCFSISQKTLISVTVKASGIKMMNTKIVFLKI